MCGRVSVQSTGFRYRVRPGRSSQRGTSKVVTSTEGGSCEFYSRDWRSYRGNYFGSCADCTLSEVGLFPERPCASSDRDHQSNAQNCEPGEVHRNCWYGRSTSQPRKQTHGGSDDCIIPPSALIGAAHFMSVEFGEYILVIESVAFAFSLDGGVSR